MHRAIGGQCRRAATSCVAVDADLWSKRLQHTMLFGERAAVASWRDRHVCSACLVAKRRGCRMDTGEIPARYPLGNPASKSAVLFAEHRRRASRKCQGPALRAAAVNARRTGTREATNTRSGVDGGEHSATLDCVMAGGLILRPYAVWSAATGRCRLRSSSRAGRRTHRRRTLQRTRRTSPAPVTQHAMM